VGRGIGGICGKSAPTHEPFTAFAALPLSVDELGQVAAAGLLRLELPATQCNSAVYHVGEGLPVQMLTEGGLDFRE